MLFGGFDFLFYHECEVNSCCKLFVSESERVYIESTLKKIRMGPELILLLGRPYTISYCRLKWENGPMCQNLSNFQHHCGLLNVYVADGNSGGIQCIAHIPCWAKRKGSSPAFPLCCTMNLGPYCPEAKVHTCRDVRSMEQKELQWNTNTLLCREVFLSPLGFLSIRLSLGEMLSDYFRWD